MKEVKMKKAKPVKVVLFLGYIFSSMLTHNVLAFDIAQEPSSSIDKENTSYAISLKILYVKS